MSIWGRSSTWREQQRETLKYTCGLSFIPGQGSGKPRQLCFHGYHSTQGSSGELAPEPESEDGVAELGQDLWLPESVPPRTQPFLGGVGICLYFR